jgi:tetratricopeptide (TPR) repeat protein
MVGTPGLGGGDASLAPHRTTSVARPDACARGALLGASLLDEAAGEYGRARSEVEEALAIAQASGDREREQAALTRLGSLLAALGRQAEGRTRCEEALTLARELGDRNVSSALNNLAAVVFAQNDFAGARVLWEESLSLRRRAGAQLSLANVLLSLAWLEIHDLDYEQAVGYLDEALAIARDAAAPLLTAFERTGANGCERSLAFAMQKVVGSSPIIRSPESPANRGFSVA